MKLKSLALVSVFACATACTPVSTQSNTTEETTVVNQVEGLEGLVEDVRIVELPNIHNASVEHIVTYVRDTKSQKLFGILEQDMGSPTLSDRKVYLGRVIQILPAELKIVTNQKWEKILKDASGKDASYLEAGIFGAEMSLFRSVNSLTNLSLDNVLKDFEAKFDTSDEFCSVKYAVKTLNAMPELKVVDIEKMVGELAGDSEGIPDVTKIVDKAKTTPAVAEFFKDITSFDSEFADKVSSAAQDETLTLVTGNAGLAILNGGIHLTFLDSKNSEVVFFAIGGCH